MSVPHATELPVPSPDPRIDDRGQIAADVPCRQCQYNLRGLDREGRCPECGGAVASSLQSDRLRFANPRWVATLARGSRMVLGGLAAVIAAAILLLVLRSVRGKLYRGSSAIGALIDALDPGLALLIMLGGAVVFCAGIWFITTPDPAGLGEDRYATSRKSVRAALLLYILRRVLDEVLNFVGPVPVSFDPLLRSLYLVSALAGMIAVFAYVRYLSKLAMRIPETALVRSGNRLFRALFVLPAAMVAIAIGRTSLGTGTAARFWATLVDACMTAAALGLLYLLIRFQYRIGKACREQAKLALEAYRAEPAAARRARLEPSRAVPGEAER